jgi:hypothetical protein
MENPVVDTTRQGQAAKLKATARQRAESRKDNHANLIANGWPNQTDNQRHFFLKPYGRVYTAFVRGKGFWMHLEGDTRVAFGREYDAAVRALIRIIEPGVESIVIV